MFNLKDKLTFIKEKFTNVLVVTHPLRTILFLCLMAPLLIPIAFGGLIGFVYCLLAPFSYFSNINVISFDSILAIGKSFCLWILAIAIAVTSAGVGLYGLFLYTSEIYNSIYLLFFGKTTKGIITKTWNTRTRPSSSDVNTLYCEVSFVPEGFNNSIILTGSSQRSFLQELLEIEIIYDKEVLVVYDPKNPFRARIKHIQKWKTI